MFVTYFVIALVNMVLMLKIRKEEKRASDREEKEKTISSQATRFEEFWSSWPSSKRKVGKAAVQAKWQRHHLDKVADQILAHVASMKTSEQWTTGYEPAPMTYINQRRWEDDEFSGHEVAQGRRVI